MQVSLLAQTNNPSDVIVSSARTCYSASGLVLPEDSSSWGRKQSLLEDLFKSGHHTTLQHSYVTLGIKAASRHFIWRFLHGHQYYNSEQVSQRYTTVKPEHFFYPDQIDRDVLFQLYSEIYASYLKIVDLLMPIVDKEIPTFKKKSSLDALLKRKPGATEEEKNKALLDPAKKKAQEMARYILPVSVTADLYHTVNVATALRYIASAKNATECVDEINEFVLQLESILIDLDPILIDLISEAKKEGFSENNYETVAGVYSLKNMLHWKKTDIVKVYDITTSNIDVFGHRFDSNAFANILSSNQVQSGPEHLDGFSSLIKISLSADAQNQRHRRSVGFRPPLKDFYERYGRDFYIPPVVAAHPEVLEEYVGSINKLYNFIEEQTRVNAFETLVYLLPNAHNVYIVERNDFASFFHKAKMRLCWNAQQEIYDITLEQIRQMRALGVQFMDYFGAPCHVRSRLGIGPTCPEGIRFCGTKVWKQKPGELIRNI